MFLVVMRCEQNQDQEACEFEFFPRGHNQPTRANSVWLAEMSLPQENEIR